jgi:hypothetical protein
MQRVTRLATLRQVVGAFIRFCPTLAGLGLRCSVFVRIRPAGFEPATKGLCIPLYLSIALRHQTPVCGLDSLFPLRVCRRVSAPSSPKRGLAQDYHAPEGLGFPEFDRFYPGTRCWKKLPVRDSGTTQNRGR